MITLTEGLAFIAKEAQLRRETRSPASELIRLEEAPGRILASIVRTDRDYPPFNRAAMDGYAIRSQGYSRDQTFKIRGEILAGEAGEAPESGAVRIMTGAAVPEGLDAIVKLEESEEISDEVHFQREEISPYFNIARKGEDLRQGDEVLQPGHFLDVSAISLLASLGYDEVSVASLPRVSVLSTGDEVVSVSQSPSPFQIRDSNSQTINAFLRFRGIQPALYGPVRDQREDLHQSLSESLESDLLILSGGVSMGSRDLVPQILEALGVRKVFHRIAIKPGKPLWFGTTDRCTVFGLPGNPFSVQVCCRIFVNAWLRAWLGQSPEQPLYYRFAEQRKKKNELSEFLPVEPSERVGYRKEATALRLRPFNGSGDVSAGLHSSGIILHSPESKDLRPGDFIPFYPW